MPESMDKQEAIETLEIFRNDYTREDSAICRAIDIAIDALRNQIVETEERHGQWVPVTNDDFGFASKFKCTYCGDIVRLSVPITKCNYKYCKNCGTRMDVIDTSVGGKRGVDSG